MQVPSQKGSTAGGKAAKALASSGAAPPLVKPEPSLITWRVSASAYIFCIGVEPIRPSIYFWLGKAAKALAYSGAAPPVVKSEFSLTTWRVSVMSLKRDA